MGFYALCNKFPKRENGKSVCFYWHHINENRVFPISGKKSQTRLSNILRMYRILSVFIYIKQIILIDQYSFCIKRTLPWLSFFLNDAVYQIINVSTVH